MSLKAKCSPVFFWFCKNRQTGEITIAQKPNLILSLTFAAFAVRFALQIFDAPSNVVSVFRWASVILLLLFGLDELFRGVNPWRRTLGLAVCVMALISIFNIVTTFS